MFPRLVRFTRHACAVVTTTALMLVASVHTASSDRPFDVVRTYSQSFAQRVVDSFEHAVISRVAFTLPRSFSTTAATPFDDAYHDLDVIAPSIQRVVVTPDGHATLSGIATPGVEIIIQSRRRALGRTKVLSTGQWQLRLDQALDQGIYRMRSVAHVPDSGYQHPGQEIRIALPQTLSKPLVVLDNIGDLKAVPAVHRVGERHTAQGQTDVRLAQAGAGEKPTRDRRDRRRQAEDRGGFTAPLYDWLQRSAIAYDRWIVDDLSGGDQGFKYVLRGRDAEVENDFGDLTDREFKERESLSGAGESWQSFRVGIIEWFRQARRSYRDNIVDELSTGERVSRDRFARAKPDQDRTKLRRGMKRRFNGDDWLEVQPKPDPSTERASQDPEPAPEWPVVDDDSFVPPQLPDVKPDPEKEALIRKAEEDAEKAREWARKAAEQAEATRRATEELLAEEKRLESNWAARRAAAKQAAAEAELKRRAEEAEKGTLTAEAKAKEAERLAKARAAKEKEDRNREAAQRKKAEELAAEASAAADREFAAGRVREPPASKDADLEVAEKESDTQPATTPRTTQEFAVADTKPTRRLSIKDSAKDAVIEEGSTLGDIDDFDPSVRFVFDMGDGALPKAKKKKARVYKKRRFKSRKAKRKRRYRKVARKRRSARSRAYRKRRSARSRAYRKRRACNRRRAYVRRAHRKRHRRVRRYGRPYRYKARQRKRYRRHVYARLVFVPRLRWRRW